MAKNFKELQAKMPREARVRSEEAAKKMISEMGLAELREAMDLTQESLADTLHVKMMPFHLLCGPFFTKNKSWSVLGKTMSATCPLALPIQR